LAFSAILMLALLVLLAMAVGFGGRNAPRVLLAPTDQVIAYADGGLIHLARPDGSEIGPLSSSTWYATSPVFSPDGSRVAYLAAASAGDPEHRLLIDSVDGSAATINASQGMNVVVGDVPNFTWSGDSSQIAFSAVDGDVSRIFRTNADGSGEIEALTSGPSNADLPSWSPDSQTLVYRSSDRDGVHTNLRRIYPIPQNTRNDEVLAGLVTSDGYFSRPRWFPDEFFDQELGYAMRTGFGSATAVVIDAGVGHGNAIWNDGLGGLPDWGVSVSPDGSQLAFLSAEGEAIVAAFDADIPPYDGPVSHVGAFAGCWLDWSADGTSLYGGSPNGCDHLVVIPIQHPEDAVTLPMTISGVADWRPLPK
jgi:WD40 repeat protein